MYSGKKVEAFRLKRALPYVELLSFLAAWAVGITLAVAEREPSPAAPREQEIVATDQSSYPFDLPRHRSFRPIPSVEIQEGG